MSTGYDMDLESGYLSMTADQAASLPRSDVAEETANIDSLVFPDAVQPLSNDFNAKRVGITSRREPKPEDLNWVKDTKIESDQALNDMKTSVSVEMSHFFRPIAIQAVDKNLAKVLHLKTGLGCFIYIMYPIYFICARGSVLFQDWKPEAQTFSHHLHRLMALSMHIKIGLGYKKGNVATLVMIPKNLAGFIIKIWTEIKALSVTGTGGKGEVQARMFDNLLDELKLDLPWAGVPDGTKMVKANPQRRVLYDFVLSWRRLKYSNKLDSTIAYLAAKQGDAISTKYHDWLLDAKTNYETGLTDDGGNFFKQEANICRLLHFFMFCRECSETEVRQGVAEVKRVFSTQVSETAGYERLGDCRSKMVKTINAVMVDSGKGKDRLMHQYQSTFLVTIKRVADIFSGVTVVTSPLGLLMSLPTNAFKWWPIIFMWISDTVYHTTRSLIRGSHAVLYRETLAADEHTFTWTGMLKGDISQVQIREAPPVRLNCSGKMMSFIARVRAFANSTCASLRGVISQDLPGGNAREFNVSLNTSEREMREDWKATVTAFKAKHSALKDVAAEGLAITYTDQAPGWEYFRVVNNKLQISVAGKAGKKFWRKFDSFDEMKTLLTMANPETLDADE